MGSALTCCAPSGRTIELNGKTLRVLECVGEGGFSFVYRVQNVTTGQVYALKKMFVQSKEQLQDAQWEIEVHHSINSPYCLQLVDHAIFPVANSVTTKEVVMLMPYYSRGSLQGLLSSMRKQNTHFSETELLRLFIGICEGVQAFHKHDPCWAHRDLKPANILLADDGTPILMDFGSTSPARITVTTRSQALAIQELAAERCTPQFRPPELYDVRTGATLDERSDVWALGCILFCMAFLASPFESAVGEFGGSIGLAVMQAKYQVPADHPYSPAIVELIRCMLVADVKQRLYCDQIIPKARAMLDQLVEGEIQQTAVQPTSSPTGSTPMLPEKNAAETPD